MRFAKMHGLGNDFIVIYGLREVPERVGELAVRMCDRHFGVGADGLVFILPSARADCRMRIFNADGSEAEQCGNAIRCVAKYVYDHGIVDTVQPRIETAGAGVQQLTLSVSGGKVDAVRVNMGAPVLEPARIPTTFDGERLVDETIEAAGRPFRITALSMGNPHCVVFVDDAEAVDLERWGPALEHHPLFPNRTNVEFVTVRTRRQLHMRVWERGAGPTLACGTGACASLVAAVLNGIAERSADVRLPGGSLHIEWDERDGNVYMTGPAETVFFGEWS